MFDCYADLSGDAFHRDNDRESGAETTRRVKIRRVANSLNQIFVNAGGREFGNLRISLGFAA